MECFHVFTNYTCRYVMTGAESELPVGSPFQTIQNSLAFPISRVGKIREEVQTRKEKKCVLHNMGSLKTL